MMVKTERTVTSLDTLPATNFYSTGTRPLRRKLNYGNTETFINHKHEDHGNSIFGTKSKRRPLSSLSSPNDESFYVSVNGSDLCSTLTNRECKLLCRSKTSGRINKKQTKIKFTPIKVFGSNSAKTAYKNMVLDVSADEDYTYEAKRERASPPKSPETANTANQTKENNCHSHYPSGAGDTSPVSAELSYNAAYENFNYKKRPLERTVSGTSIYNDKPVSYPKTFENRVEEPATSPIKIVQPSEEPVPPTPKAPERQPDDPVPLHNLGNTCYMNSVVQSLLSLAFLTNDLEETHKKLETIAEEDNLTVTRALLRLIKEYNAQRIPTEENELDNNLTQLKKCVGKISSPFKSSHQQDAVEFLQIIIENIEEEFKKFKDNLAPKENPITRNFLMETDSSLKCLTCHHVLKLPPTQYYFLYLSIPDNIVNSDFTLQNAVTNCFAEEKTEHKCEQNECNGKDKIRYVSISKIPKILVMQLGRYSEEGEKRSDVVMASEVVKLPFNLQLSSKRDNKMALSERSISPVRNNVNNEIQDHVNSPFKSIQLSPVKQKLNGNDALEENNKENVIDEHGSLYDLVAVICHHGLSLTGGHYICYIKNPRNNEWYQCDDDSITETTLDKVQDLTKRSGYCFFYTLKRAY